MVSEISVYLVLVPEADHMTEDQDTEGDRNQTVQVKSKARPLVTQVSA